MTVEQLTVPVEDDNPIEAVLLAHPSLDAYGSEFLAQAGQLSTEHPEVADAYFTLYERLAMQVGNTAWMFPESEREAARQATIGLFGSTINTVLRHHAAGNETKTQVPLIGRQPAKVDLYGTEPLMILDSLTQAYWAAGQVMPDDPSSTVRSVLAEKGDGYTNYRFIDTSPDPYLPPCSSLYLREQASSSFNPRREYGNAGGVEARVAFRVDVKLLREHMSGRTARMISLSTAPEANDGVVCLRIDRSGIEIEMDDGTVRRLPTTVEGTVAHDIGSVVHDGAGGVGPFLAVHNDTLNHVPIAPGLGRADVFATHVRELDAKVAERLIRTPGLRRVLRRQQLGHTTLGGFPAFVIGQNPYDIPGVRELAAYSGIELSTQPNDEEIQRLFNAWGTQAAFQYNIPKMRGSTASVDYEHLAQQIGRSNILGDMPMRTVVDRSAPLREVPNVLVREAVTSWFNKRANYVQWAHEQGLQIGRVILGATERPLNTPTEVTHPDVVALQRQLRRQPTAVDLMHGPIREGLERAGVENIEMIALPYKQARADGSMRVTSGNDVVRAIAEAYPDIADGPVLDTLNAPAGGMFIGAFKTLLDTLPTFSPEQYYMGHNRAYVARTYVDNITTRFFQNVYSAPSSLVRWIAAVHQANKQFKV